MLTKQLDGQGKWLFRWRSYLPLMLAPLILVAMLRFTYPLGSHELDLAREYLCLGLALLGLFMRVITVGFAARHTSGRGTHRMKADVLSTTGVYSVVRHPLYLANFVIFFAVLMDIGQWWLVLTGSLLYWIYYERIMVAEEAFLQKLHGETFELWASQTPAVLPDARRWRRPRLAFSWRSALRREYTTLFLIVCLFTAVEVVGDLVLHRELKIDDGWGAVFLTGLAIYVVCRFAKKRQLLIDPTR